MPYDIGATGAEGPGEWGRGDRKEGLRFPTAKTNWAHKLAIWPVQADILVQKRSVSPSRPILVGLDQSQPDN